MEMASGFRIYIKPSREPQDHAPACGALEAPVRSGLH
jgi:hypothetical protein